MAAVNTTPPAQVTDPATHIEAVTPSDSVELQAISTALYVSAEGNVSVVMADGSQAVIYLLAGIPHPLRVKQVRATGTDTLTGIVAISQVATF